MCLFSLKRLPPSFLLLTQFPFLPLFTFFYLSSIPIFLTRQCSATRQHRFIFAELHESLRSCTCMYVWIPMYTYVSGSNVPWHGPAIRRRDIWQHSSQILRLKQKLLRKILRKVGRWGIRLGPTPVAPSCFAFELSNGKYFASAPAKCDRKSSIELERERIFEYQYSDNGIRTRTCCPEGQGCPTVPNTQTLKSTALQLFYINIYNSTIFIQT